MSEKPEIPARILIFDSRIKQIVNYYFSQDKETRQVAFKRFWKACETTTLKDELKRYWATGTLRLAKQAAKRENGIQSQKERELMMKAFQTGTLQQNKKEASDLKEKNTNHSEKPIKEIKNVVDYDAALRQYGVFLSKSRFNSFKESIERASSMDKVEDLFFLHSYKYDPKKLARFLLACFDHHLIAQRDKMQEEINLLLQKKETRRLQKRQEAPQLTYVPWETIEFCNGMVKFYPFRLNGALILKTRQPFVVNCRDSKASYNHIKQHFVNVLPQIRAYQKGADIVGLESELYLRDAIRILQKKYEFADWESDDSAIPFSASYKGSSDIGQDKVLANLRKRKSSYFNYLIQRQLKGNRIVPCTELMVHSDGIGDSEDAFIFCLSSYSQDVIKLVFENVNEARATIVFEVTSVLAEKALRCLFDFMRSEECNKRQRLHYRKFNFQNYGVTRYYLVNHTTLGEWKYNL